MPLKPLNLIKRLDNIKKKPWEAYSVASNVFKNRWPAAEPYIMQDPIAAFYYANEVLKERWPEAEPYIMKNIDVANLYNRNIMKGKWPELLNYIKKDAKAASEYCIFNKVRWPEAEPYIAMDLEAAIIYLREIKQSKWPELEQEILKQQDIDSALEYAKQIGERVSALEPLLTRDNRHLHAYIGDVLKGPWPEAEDELLLDPKLATLYAIDYKPKWPDLEAIIKNKPEYKNLWDVYTGKRSRYYI